MPPAECLKFFQFLVEGKEGSNTVWLIVNGILVRLVGNQNNFSSPATPLKHDGNVTVCPANIQ
jgi:hypothetical protein